MKTILILAFLFFSSEKSFSQTASIDFEFSDYMDKSDSLFVQEWEWKLNGELFTPNSARIEIPTWDNDQFDTLFFCHYGNWDTILCKLVADSKYSLIFNECCGGFYITEKNIITGKVTFALPSDSTESVSIETDFQKVELSAQNKNVEVSFLRGGMDPNIYEITLGFRKNQYYTFLYAPIDNHDKTILIDPILRKLKISVK